MLSIKFKIFVSSREFCISKYGPVCGKTSNIGVFHKCWKDGGEGGGSSKFDSMVEGGGLSPYIGEHRGASKKRENILRTSVPSRVGWKNLFFC